MATKKSTTKSKTADSKKVEPEVEEKVSEVKAQQEPAPKKKFNLKEFLRLVESARKLIRKDDYKKVETLTSEPGVIIRAFKDVNNIPTLHAKYEKEGEVLANIIEKVHKF